MTYITLNYHTVKPKRMVDTEQFLLYAEEKNVFKKNFSVFNSQK